MFKGPNVPLRMPGSKGPFKDARVQRSKCSRVKASKGPRVQRSMTPETRGYKGPRSKGPRSNWVDKRF